MKFVALLVLGCSLTVGCSKGSGTPLRSPALDYQPPAAGTSDGDVVGADRRGPGDKLHEGVTSDAPAPGWDASNAGLNYDPKQRVGGATEKPAAGSSTK
jgi:hypothetical protein